MKLICIGSFTGRRRPTVKEEPRSPAQGKKRKANSVSDASSIGRSDATGFDFEATEPNGKRQKMASGSSTQVRFDGIMVPPVKAPRRSTRSAKANSKKDINELFERLGQEFGAVAKTCKDIAETIE
jgi:hypothetical protein